MKPSVMLFFSDYHNAIYSRFNAFNSGFNTESLLSFVHCILPLFGAVFVMHDRLKAPILACYDSFVIADYLDPWQPSLIVDN
jgi:ATP adenylyltransferase/5',5'''-P-1,P-4-tetraphosphate phosphorylase II